MIAGVILPLQRTTDRRPATTADCDGCVNAFLNAGDKRCWSLVHARMVPKFQAPSKGSLFEARWEPVIVPQCYSRNGWWIVNDTPEPAPIARSG